MHRLVFSTLLACLTTAACADSPRDARATEGAATRPAATGQRDGGSRAELSADAAAALDRANAEFRAGRYEAALAAYRGAAVHAPDHAAPWYGVYMVARATRDAALADSAMSAIRARTPSASGFSDSALARMHAGGAATTPGGALPPGHPAVTPKAMPRGHAPVPPATPQAATRTGT